MKLVIEVKEEDYKRYKEDKICSYTSAVLDAVPLNEVLDKIRAEIEEYSLLTRERVIGIIDKYKSESEDKE